MVNFSRRPVVSFKFGVVGNQQDPLAWERNAVRPDHIFQDIGRRKPSPTSSCMSHHARC